MIHTLFTCFLQCYCNHEHIEALRDDACFLVVERSVEDLPDGRFGHYIHTIIDGSIVLRFLLNSEMMSHCAGPPTWLNIFKFLNFWIDAKSP